MATQEYISQLIQVPQSVDAQLLQAWLQRELNLPELPSYAWQWQPNADESLKIADVRTLQQELAYTPTTTIRVVVLRHVDSASPAAQNALLKLVEEPPRQTVLVLLDHGQGNILPTLRSRTVARTFTEVEASPATIATELPFELATLTPAQVLDLAESVTDRPQALELCELYLKNLHLQVGHNPSPAKIHQLKQLENCWHDLQANLNVKLTLEHYFFLISSLNRSD